jgi:hypothetical protein
LYRYVLNSPLNYTDPFGNNPAQDLWNFLTTNETVYNIANGADQVLAGFSHAVTFGVSTQLRTALYNEGDWQFHAGENIHEDESRIVALSEIVELDLSVLELADLPTGTFAIRKSANEPWQRFVL